MMPPETFQQVFMRTFQNEFVEESLTIPLEITEVHSTCMNVHGYPRISSKKSCEGMPRETLERVHDAP